LAIVVAAVLRDMVITSQRRGGNLLRAKDMRRRTDRVGEALIPIVAEATSSIVAGATNSKQRVPPQNSNGTCSSSSLNRGVVGEASLCSGGAAS
jgi:hypothetical protein